MARIRTIKPDFQLSERVGRCSRDARLTFALLMPQADDEGRCLGASRALASVLHPFDDDAPNFIEKWLCELESARLITRYLVDGTSYLAINDWFDFQKIDRPSLSKYPPPPKLDVSREGSRALGEDTANTIEPSALEGKGIGREEERESDTQTRARTDASVERASTQPSATIVALKSLEEPTSPTSLRHYPDDFEQFWRAFPSVPNSSKADAYKAWGKLNRELPAMDVLLACVDAYKRHVAAENVKRRANEAPMPWCHPSTWLNGRRWEGFVEASTKAREASTNRSVVLESLWGGHPAAARLRKEIGAGEFDSWLAPLAFEMVEGLPFLIAPSRIIHGRVSDRYLDKINAAFNAEVGIVFGNGAGSAGVHQRGAVG